MSQQSTSRSRATPLRVAPLWTLALTLLVAGVATTTAAASQRVSEPSGQKTLAATLGVYVFPTEGQSSEVQSRQEAECYSWAVETTQSDPFELEREATQQLVKASQDKQAVASAQPPPGTAARAAVGGAAVGALIGEIASDDAGKGAAWGAAAGLVGTRRRTRRARQSASEQIDQQTARTQQYTAEQIEGFKKAFTVCLEAKKYLVRL